MRDIDPTSRKAEHLSITNDMTVHSGQRNWSRSTKADPLVRSIINHVLANSIRIALYKERTLRDLFFQQRSLPSTLPGKGKSMFLTTYLRYLILTESTISLPIVKRSSIQSDITLPISDTRHNWLLREFTETTLPERRTLASRARKATCGLRDANLV